MSIDWTLLAIVGGPVVGAAIGAALTRAFERRPRLTTYMGHVGSHTLVHDDGTQSGVHTHVITILNSGGKPAENVRISHNKLPNYTLYPEIKHEVEELPGGVVDLVFPSFSPGEQLQISYLYFPPLTFRDIHYRIACGNGPVRTLPVLLTRMYPMWFNYMAIGSMALGAIGAIYLLVTAAGKLVAD